MFSVLELSLPPGTQDQLASLKQQQMLAVLAGSFCKCYWQVMVQVVHAGLFSSEILIRWLLRIRIASVERIVNILHHITNTLPTKGRFHNVSQLPNNNMKQVSMIPSSRATPYKQGAGIRRWACTSQHALLQRFCHAAHF